MSLAFSGRLSREGEVLAGLPKSPRESAVDFGSVFETTPCGAAELSVEALCLTTVTAAREEESGLTEADRFEAEITGKAKKITDKKNNIFLQCRIYGKSLFQRKRNIINKKY
jgi:hypothetical protein